MNKNKVIGNILLFAIGIAIGTCAALQIPKAKGAEPILRQGYNCPSGYDRKRGYCVPHNSSSTKEAITQSGSSCPDGYDRSRGYCIPHKNNNNSSAIPRQGISCPNGYDRKGDYCQKR